LVQVTVAPTGTVRDTGPKLKLSIFTRYCPFEAFCPLAAGPAGLLLDNPKARPRIAIVAVLKIALLMGVFS
jgi:hypothetical protein